MNQDQEKETLLPGVVAVGGGAIGCIGGLMLFFDARDLKSYTSAADK